MGVLIWVTLPNTTPHSIILNYNFKLASRKTDSSDNGKWSPESSIPRNTFSCDLIECRSFTGSSAKYFCLKIYRKMPEDILRSKRIKNKFLHIFTKYKNHQSTHQNQKYVGRSLDPCFENKPHWKYHLGKFAKNNISSQE